MRHLRGGDCHNSRGPCAGLPSVCATFIPISTLRTSARNISARRTDDSRSAVSLASIGTHSGRTLRTGRGLTCGATRRTPRSMLDLSPHPHLHTQ